MHIDPVILLLVRGHAHWEGRVVVLYLGLVAQRGAIVGRGEDPAAGSGKSVGNLLKLVENVLASLGGVRGRVGAQNGSAILEGSAFRTADLFETKRKKERRSQLQHVFVCLCVS